MPLLLLDGVPGEPRAGGDGWSRSGGRPTALGRRSGAGRDRRRRPAGGRVHRNPTRIGSVVVDPAHHSVFSRPRWRLLDQEKILRRDLRGYTEYSQRVRYRLIPYLW